MASLNIWTASRPTTEGQLNDLVHVNRIPTSRSFWIMGNENVNPEAEKESMSAENIRILFFFHAQTLSLWQKWIPGVQTWPVRRADNLSTFMWWLSRNSGSHKGLYRPVQQQLYLYHNIQLTHTLWLHWRKKKITVISNVTDELLHTMKQSLPSGNFFPWRFWIRTKSLTHSAKKSKSRSPHPSLSSSPMW